MGNLCSQDILPSSRRPHTVVGPTCFTSPPLLTVSRWLPFCILSYRISVRLLFRWFSRLMVLCYSFNFNVVMGGGKHSIYLPCHPDQNSPSYFTLKCESGYAHKFVLEDYLLYILLMLHIIFHLGRHIQHTTPKYFPCAVYKVI